MKKLLTLFAVALFLSSGSVIAQSTDKELLQNLQSQLQKAESEKTAKVQGNSWTEADETAHKKRVEDLTAQMKTVQGRIANAPAADPKAAARAELVSKKKELDQLENQRVTAKQAKTWTDKDEGAYTKKKAELQNKIKALADKVK